MTSVTCPSHSASKVSLMADPALVPSSHTAYLELAAPPHYDLTLEEICKQDGHGHPKIGHAWRGMNSPQCSGLGCVIPLTLLVSHPSAVDMSVLVADCTLNRLPAWLLEAYQGTNEGQACLWTQPGRLKVRPAGGTL